jgi:DNA-binding MarR family transcriptional regulator
METSHLPAADRVQAQLSWLLNQAALAANRLVAEALASAGARRHHFALLAALDEFGPASQADLSRRTTIDRSDMVAAVNELAGDGAVERTRDPADRRRNVVRITRKGRGRLRTLGGLLAGAQDELLAPLSATERATLIRLLTRLVDN